MTVAPSTSGTADIVRTAKRYTLSEAPATRRKDHSCKDFERQDWKRNQDVYNSRMKNRIK